jgi:hypothetical protein
MSTETKLQEFIHLLEEGGWARWIARALLAMAVLYVASAWLFRDSGFRGLSHEKAIEQAQISRELAQGHGFSTLMIRPAALWQFKSQLGRIPNTPLPDTFHAPLNPFLNSILLRLTRGSWKMTPNDVVYINDKVIVSAQLCFFLLAVLITHFTTQRLFDRRLSVLVTGFLLLCESFWDFSMSGLPQMLLLLLFSCCIHLLVRLLEARHAGKPTLGWSAALGSTFGLLALAHAITLFIFAGTLCAAILFLKPRGRDAAVMAGACLLLVAPWLARNQSVCGNPLGLAGYSSLSEVLGSESQIMRSMDLQETLKSATPRLFTLKVRRQLQEQLGSLFHYLGHILAAPVFFVALLHAFKRPETAQLRWWLLLMWLSALLGMSILGLEPFHPGIQPVSLKANDLHVLFIPLMTAYGLAFLLVLWSRLEIAPRLFRNAFLAGLYTLSSLPFLSQFLELHRAQPLRVHWPPYVPPYISLLSEWTDPNEVILSDMPWAVAWYAQRSSLWLPTTRQEYLSLHAFNSIGPIAGLYLTPMTGNRSFWADIGRGEFSDWAPFVLHQSDVGDFPLRYSTAMPVNDECVFYTDSPRWTTRKASTPAEGTALKGK